MTSLILSAILQAQSTSLVVDFSQPGVKVSPVLYGLMTEEINYSYEGGLYGNVLRNRTFKDDARNPAHWSPLNAQATVKLMNSGGINAQLKPWLDIKGGVSNGGFWGIPVRPNTEYSLEMWARNATSGELTAKLVSTVDGTVYASTKITGIERTWKKFEAKLRTADLTPTAQATFVVESSADGTFHLGPTALFPPTYGNRKHGFRPDIMQKLVDMKPKFLRFPGGNYLEGSTFKDRFNWKKTIGALEDRPGHRAPWGYFSTDGMGLMEFLYWCEDMGAEPVLGIFAGYVLNKDYIEAGPELEGFVKDALDQIEFITGDPKETKWGRIRAEMGRTKPFKLRYVEIGNEDGFDDSGSYEDRFVQFYDAIKRKYPKLNVISSTGGQDWLGARFPITKRKPDSVDEHYYGSVWDLLSFAHKYDTYDRKGPKIFVGEYAAQDVPEPWTRPQTKGPTPILRSAIADAAYLTGIERNSDIVEMACYAPLLVNVNPGARQWAINLIGYDALNVFVSPSYHVQQLFATHLGDQTVMSKFVNPPTQSRGEQTIPAVFASATKDEKAKKLYLKLVNSLDKAVTIDVELKAGSVGSAGTVYQLTGDPNAMNSLEEPNKIAPTKKSETGFGAKFARSMPPSSVEVIVLDLK